MMLLSHVVLKSSHLVPLSKVTNKPELLVESGRGETDGRKGERGEEAETEGERQTVQFVFYFYCKANSLCS